ncbi:MAG: ABC transporter permease [Planctomycetota bacterium]
MPDSTESFSCPTCGKRYRWKPAMAGKKVACKQCGEKLRVPAEPGGVTEVVGGVSSVVAPVQASAPADSAAGYELSDESIAEPTPRVSAPDGKCPSCNQRMKPGAVLCMNCGFHLETGTRLNTSVGGDEPVGGKKTKRNAAPAAGVDVDQMSKAVFDGRSRVDDAALDADLERENRWKYFYTPLILIGVGLVWTAINVGLLGPLANEASPITQAQGGGTAVSNGIRAAIVAINFFIRLLIQVPLTLIGLFVVANLFGTSFGTLGSAMLRLLAVIIVVGAFNDTMDLGLDIVTGGFGGIGFMLKVSLSLLVFFGVAMWQLETDVLETMVLWGVTVFLPSFIMGFALVIIIGILFF